MAAQRKVCFSHGVLTGRIGCIAMVLLFFALSSPALPRNNSGADASPVSTAEPRSSASPQAPARQVSVSAQPAAAPSRGVIERIDFLGNRRIRSDTLKARIFSRDGDPYNEETLRR
ncbi:MAG: hypothetical protein ABLQ96_06620, partial [Candidatus Acidiferrum sp.]